MNFLRGRWIQLCIHALWQAPWQVLWLTLWIESGVWAEGGVKVPQTSNLMNRLSEVRNRISALEQGIIDASRTRDNAKTQVRKIQQLLKLQILERSLCAKRKAELEKTVVELESRRDQLQKKILQQKKLIRKSLMALEFSNQQMPSLDTSQSEGNSLSLADQEKLEAPRRKILANLSDRGLKEIEMMKADLQDAFRLETRIREEKEQLSYLFQDLREKEAVLELNRQLQLDVIQRKHQERIAQLESYRKLKSAEAQVERLIGDFNARMELRKNEETERLVSKAMMQGEFFKLKGKLPFPVVGGKVVSHFGRSFDAHSGLNIFKKGIDIQVPSHHSVRSVSAGKIAFSGTMPNYGKVVIIDHGNHFYSLCAHLGEIRKKTNDPVAAQEPIGATGDPGTPLYFEIRARNVAVNPLQWLYN